jgi:CheY-like chemotaxis protein
VVEPLKSSPDQSGRRVATEDFFTTLSHELRTPLTPVLSLVSASLAEPNLPADVRESFSLIARNVQTEARLIDDLIDLLRMLDGQFEMQQAPVNLHDCLEAALNLCRSDLEPRRIGVQFVLEAVAAGSLGDPRQLPRLFAHLFRKAAHLGADGARFEVRTSNDFGNVVVEIEDVTHGVAPTVRAELVELLKVRDHAPALRRLGIGMIVGRQIVEAHRGELTVPGEGPLFVVRLPGTLAPRRVDEAPATSAIPRGTSILVVEDHEDTRRVLSRALRRRGFAVAVADTVESACRQFASQPADLIICDIGLPDGTGWDVLNRLREAGPVRAIAVSGYGTKLDVEKSQAAGFAAHILKPVDFSGLEATVARVLGSAAKS